MSDPARREELVQRHLPLVRHLARRFALAGQDLEDLVQAGCLGLLKAIDRFDPDRGVQFSTYAVPLILGEMRRYLRGEAGAVRVTRRGLELARAARLARARLEQELGREPSLRQVAAAVGADPADVLAALEATRPPASLSAPAACAEEGTPSLLDTLAEGDEEVAEVAFRRALLSQLLDRLPPRLKAVLVLRYLQDATQTEVARRLGVAQSQVSRWEQQALRRLRELAGQAEPGR